jgi:TetR/AcrR family transcriptional regulator
MTRVMIGDALVNEDDRLQARMNQFVERIELAIKQALRVAVTQGEANEAEVGVRANMITNLVIGRWHRFAKTGFKQNPSDGAQAQIALLLV